MGCVSILIKFRICKWIMLQAWNWATIKKIPKEFVSSSWEPRELKPVGTMVVVLVVVAMVSSDNTFAWFSLGRWFNPSRSDWVSLHYEQRPPARPAGRGGPLNNRQDDSGSPGQTTTVDCWISRVPVLVSHSPNQPACLPATHSCQRMRHNIDVTIS